MTCSDARCTQMSRPPRDPSHLRSRNVAANKIRQSLDERFRVRACANVTSRDPQAELPTAFDRRSRTLLSVQMRLTVPELPTRSHGSSRRELRSPKRSSSRSRRRVLLQRRMLSMPSRSMSRCRGSRRGCRRAIQAQQLDSPLQHVSDLVALGSCRSKAKECGMVRYMSEKRAGY